MTVPLLVPAGRPAIPLQWVVATGLVAAEAYFLATGNWIIAALVLAAPLYLAIAFRKPFWLLTLLIVGDPTFLVFPDSVLGVSPVVNSARVLFATLVAIGVFRILIDPRQRVRMNAVEKVMVTYAVVAGVSWLLHTSGRSPAELRLDAAIYIKGLVMPFVVFMVARRITWTRQRVFAVCGALAAAGVYLSMAGFLQVQFGLEVFHRKGYLVVQEGRATGSFTDAVEFGAVLTVILFLAVFLLGQTKRAALQLLLALASVSALIGMAFSFTRAVWIGLGVATLYIIARTGRTRLIPPMALAAIAVAAFLIMQPRVGGGVVDERLNDAGTIYSRLALYSTAGNMIAHNPLFGVGFGALTYDTNKADYYAPFGDVSAQWAAWPTVPHNQFLFVAVQTGIVGIVLYLVIIAGVWRLLTRTRRSGPTGDWNQNRFATFAQGALIVVLVHSLFADVVFFSYLLLSVFFLAGIAVSEPEENKRTPDG